MLSFKKIAWSILIILPIGVFYVFVWRYAVNFPFQDDIDGVYGALQGLIEATNPLEFIKILFKPDDEHRVIYDRFITWLLYKLNAHTSLLPHLIIGNLFVLGIFFVVFDVLKKSGQSLWSIVPVAWLLFQIQYQEGIFWGMIPCQNFAIPFFTVLAIWLILKENNWSYLAFVVAFVCTFSSGNGFLVFVSTILILLLQRRWKFLGLWVVWAAFCIFLYFHDLVIPSFRPKISDNIRDYWQLIPIHFFAFVGQYFDPKANFSLIIRGIVTVSSGLLLVGYSLFLFFDLAKHWLQKPDTKLSKEKLFWLGSIVFVLCTAAVFALGRTSDGFEAVFRSRYKLALALLMVSVYGAALCYLKNEWKQRVIYVALAVSIFMHLTAYFQETIEVDTHRKEIICDWFTWQHGENIPTSPIYFAKGPKQLVDSTLNYALKHKTYQPPTTFYSNIEKNIINDSLKNLRPFELTFTDTDEYLIFRQIEKSRDLQIDEGNYIILKSEKETHLFPLIYRKSTIKQFLTTLNYYQNTAETRRILKKGLSKGNYQIGILEVENDKTSYYFTTQTVEIKESFKPIL